MKLRRALALTVAILMFTAVIAPVASALPTVGEGAYSYVEQLEARSRVAGTSSELDAANRIKDWFEAAGYSAEFQPFTYVGKNRTYLSQNVVAYLPSTSGAAGAPLVIVGAHYDSVIAGNGADDNASGVGVLLEVAQMVALYQRDYDIAFVAFGAEEVGLEGSFYYAGQMPQADKDRAIVMINFDSLIAGDKLYIHAGANGLTQPRDAMLEIIENRGLPIEMQPGLNEHYPTGFTPDWFSDYTAFNQAGIPVVAFESTNWEIGDLDGYVQTVKYGSFWHTGKDKLATIEQRFPGRPMERLSAYTSLVSEYLEDPTP
jgi:hypothetical protein